MKKVILPRDNLGDVPQGLKGIKIEPVDNVEQALNIIFKAH